jgi:methylglutaconyl-CoA hydratase
LTDDTIQALFDCIAELKTRKDVRLVILKAEGKMFCSGNLPKTYQQNVNINENDNKNNIVCLAKFFHAFSKLPMFTVALCQGSVMGSGMGLLSVCDMVMSVRSAHFQCSDCKLGVVPAAALPYVVTKIGPSAAKRFLCLAENCSAEAAFACGLVQEIVDTPDDLTGFVTKMAEQMTLCGSYSVMASKVLVANIGGQPVTLDLMCYSADQLAKVRKSPEADAGMKAVLSRQKPYWAEDPIKP